LPLPDQDSQLATERILVAIDCSHLERAGAEKFAEPLRSLVAEPCLFGAPGWMRFRSIDVSDAHANAVDPGSVAVHDAVATATGVADCKPDLPGITNGG
jgi:hypothetical protein